MVLPGTLVLPTFGKVRSSKGSTRGSDVDGADAASSVCQPCLPPPINDGRICIACKCKDTDLDPGNPSRTRPFGYGVRSNKTGLWIGSMCWYCQRIFQVIRSLISIITFFSGHTFVMISQDCVRILLPASSSVVSSAEIQERAQDGSEVSHSNGALQAPLQ